MAGGPYASHDGRHHSIDFLGKESLGQSVCFQFKTRGLPEKVELKKDLIGLSRHAIFGTNVSGPGDGAAFSLCSQDGTVGKWSRLRSSLPWDVVVFD